MKRLMIAFMLLLAPVAHAGEIRELADEVAYPLSPALEAKIDRLDELEATHGYDLQIREFGFAKEWLYHEDKVITLNNKKRYFSELFTGTPFMKSYLQHFYGPTLEPTVGQGVVGKDVQELADLSNEIKENLTLFAMTGNQEYLAKIQEIGKELQALNAQYLERLATIEALRDRIFNSELL